MESHLLASIAFLSVAVIMVSQAAEMPPETYWNKVLPNTPMPEAVKHSLISPAAAGRDPRSKKTYVIVQPGQKTPFIYQYAANETQLHDNPNMALFFLEKDLAPGTKLNMRFTRSTNRAVFLPREDAESIPFSSNKLSEIVLKEFSVRPGSEQAKVIEETIRECEEKGVEGEEKYCATSLESMVDFVVSKLGNNINAVSTEVRKDSKVGRYEIRAKRMLTGEKAVVCHKQIYPYAVFYCHHMKSSSTRAYMVSLKDIVDGGEVMGAAVCHTDTSAWNPKHMAFQVLKVKPGNTVPICHFLPEDHVVWVGK